MVTNSSGFQSGFGNDCRNLFIGDTVFAKAGGQCLYLGAVEAREIFSQTLSDVGAHEWLVSGEAERGAISFGSSITSAGMRRLMVVMGRLR